MNLDSLKLSEASARAVAEMMLRRMTPPYLITLVDRDSSPLSATAKVDGRAWVDGTTVCIEFARTPDLECPAGKSALAFVEIANNDGVPLFYYEAGLAGPLVRFSIGPLISVSLRAF